MSVLEVKDLGVFYGRREILKGINFSVVEGESLLVAGPNGAGKSTLLKAIAGLVRVRKGKIVFKGEEITQEEPHLRVKKGLVYLKQEKEIFPSLTVRENFELAGFELETVEFEEKVEKILAWFPHLKKSWNQPAGMLSGGERKALGIGMVLMKNPDLLLLDEPTAGLSPQSAEKILQKLSEIRKSLRVTIMMVEHNLGLVAERVDRMIILKDGKITYNEILKQGLDSKKIFAFYF